MIIILTFPVHSTCFTTSHYHVHDERHEKILRVKLTLSTIISRWSTIVDRHEKKSLSKSFTLILLFAGRQLQTTVTKKYQEYHFHSQQIFVGGQPSSTVTKETHRVILSLSTIIWWWSTIIDRLPKPGDSSSIYLFFFGRWCTTLE